MFLSPYVNISYRNLTVPQCASSTSTNCSRNHSAASVPASTKDIRQTHDNAMHYRTRAPLQISTAIMDGHDGLASDGDSGADSPRSKVAQRLKAMDLRSLRAASPPTPLNTLTMARELSPSPRKRLRRIVTKHPDSDGEQVHMYAPEARNDLEIMETPQLKMPSSLPAVSQSLEVRTRQPVMVPPSPSPPDTTTKANEAQQQLRQNLDDADTIRCVAAVRNAAGPTQATLLKRPLESSQIDRAALTWKESEITGHDIDRTSPDDDGEGINGIGFKPTPAMEYVRKQRRKQQISEWKAREAREARQRRMERRRGGDETASARGAGAGLTMEGAIVLGKDFCMGDSLHAKRMVRFVGMD